MIKLLEKTKNTLFHYAIYVASFFVSYIPTSALASMIDTAKKMGWETGNCKLGSWLGGKCFMCPLFKALYDAASGVAASAYGALHSGLSILVLIGTALWVSIKILQYVSSFNQADPMKIIQEVSTQLFRTLVIFLILTANFSSVRQLTLDPVFETGMAISQSFVKQTECNSSSYTPVMSNGGLSANMGNSILCSIYAIEQKSMNIIDLGATSICLSVQEDIGIRILKFIVIPQPTFLITGILLFVIGAIYLFACPYLLLDCVINLCFASALLPVAVAGYAFKLTSKYLGIVWNTFLNAIFAFLFMSVTIYVLNVAIDDLFISVEENASKGFKGVQTFIDIFHGFPFFGINFIKLAFILALGWCVLEQAIQNANDFVDGGLNPSGSGTPDSIGSDMGKQAASASAKLTGTAVKSVKAAAGAFAEASGISDWAKDKRKQFYNRLYGRKPLDEKEPSAKPTVGPNTPITPQKLTLESIDPTTLNDELRQKFEKIKKQEQELKDLTEKTHQKLLNPNLKNKERTKREALLKGKTQKFNHDRNELLDEIKAYQTQSAKQDQEKSKKEALDARIAAAEAKANEYFKKNPIEKSSWEAYDVYDAKVKKLKENFVIRNLNVDDIRAYKERQAALREQERKQQENAAVIQERIQNTTKEMNQYFKEHKLTRQEGESRKDFRKREIAEREKYMMEHLSEEDGKAFVKQRQDEVARQKQIEARIQQEQQQKAVERAIQEKMLKEMEAKQRKEQAQAAIEAESERKKILNNNIDSFYSAGTLFNDEDDKK